MDNIIVFPTWTQEQYLSLLDGLGSERQLFVIDVKPVNLCFVKIYLDINQPES